jgi:hypothetical protein
MPLATEVLAQCKVQSDMRRMISRGKQGDAI